MDSATRALAHLPLLPFLSFTFFLQEATTSINHCKSRFYVNCTNLILYLTNQWQNRSRTLWVIVKLYGGKGNKNTPICIDANATLGDEMKEIC